MLNYSKIKGILCDITGVLYESGTDGGHPIEGSIEAVKRLHSLNIPIQFLTNESSCSISDLIKKLNSFGFSLSENEVTSPVSYIVNMLETLKLSPYLLVSPEIKKEFSSLPMNNLDCVVLGDGCTFDFVCLNQAFNVLVSNVGAKIFSMGNGKYYKDDDRLKLDIGPFAVALNYASGAEVVVAGKPSESFFEVAFQRLKHLGVANLSEIVMIGDDLENDVIAAQNLGCQGVQVCTGKYRADVTIKSPQKPHGIVDNLAHFVDELSGGRSALQ